MMGVVGFGACLTQTFLATLVIKGNWQGCSGYLLQICGTCRSIMTELWLGGEGAQAPLLFEGGHRGGYMWFHHYVN